MDKNFVVIINQLSLNDSEEFEGVMTKLHSANKICFNPTNPYGPKYTETHYIITAEQYPVEVFEALKEQGDKIDLYFGSSIFGVSTNKYGFFIPKLKYAAQNIGDLCDGTKREYGKNDLSDYAIFETKCVSISDLCGSPKKVSEPMNPWTPDNKHWGNKSEIDSHFETFYQEKQNLKIDIMKETGKRLRGLSGLMKDEIHAFIVFEDLDRKHDVAIATSMIVAITPIESEEGNTVEIVLVNGLRYKANVKEIVSSFTGFIYDPS